MLFHYRPWFTVTVNIGLPVTLLPTSLWMSSSLSRPADLSADSAVQGWSLGKEQSQSQSLVSCLWFPRDQSNKGILINIKLHITKQFKKSILVITFGLMCGFCLIVNMIKYFT